MNHPLFLTLTAVLTIPVILPSCAGGGGDPFLGENTSGSFSPGVIYPERIPVWSSVEGISASRTKKQTASLENPGRSIFEGAQR